MSGFVGEQNSPEGLSGFDSDRRGRLGDAIVSQLHGKYYESVVRGRVFNASVAAAGIALIVPATTGNHPSLWNPAGSGVNLSIIRLELGYVSGNNAPTTIEWARTADAGAFVIGTGLPVVTWTNVAPVSALVGGGSASLAKWAPAINTYTAAPVFFRTSSLSLFTGVAATAVAPFQLRAEYDGDLVVAPGNVISLCTVGATTTSLLQVSVIYEEVPV